MFYMNFSREIALFENLVIVHITLLVEGFLAYSAGTPIVDKTDTLVAASCMA